MKKVLVMVALVMVSVIVYAFNDRAEAKQGKKEVTGNNGEVIVMNKEMFLKDVFDYEKSKEWKYKGDKPAIIDLYADWCGPCRQTAPIMKELAKEYAGKIVIYKVNVDKQKELAALFNATSIPLFVFIPMKGDPVIFFSIAPQFIGLAGIQIAAAKVTVIERWNVVRSAVAVHTENSRINGKLIPSDQKLLEIRVIDIICHKAADIGCPPRNAGKTHIKAGLELIIEGFKGTRHIAGPYNISVFLCISRAR